MLGKEEYQGTRNFELEKVSSDGKNPVKILVVNTKVKKLDSFYMTTKKLGIRNREMLAYSPLPKKAGT